MIDRLAISGYRSLRDLRVTLTRGVVVTGANGVGKSSLYRALRLLADVAQGRIVASLAEEGGLSSILWAGPENIGRHVRSGAHPVQGTVRAGPVSLKLGFACADVGYAIDLGLPIQQQTAFGLDPEIKAEALWAGGKFSRRNAYGLRNGPSARLLQENAEWRRIEPSLAPFDSMMTHAAGGADGHELLGLRERLRGWRFYDNLRADRDAPARRRRIGTRTVALAGDGGDLAAALQTIVEIGDADALDDAIADAFAGARLRIDVDGAGMFDTRLEQHGLLRPLAAAELSEGTLRYLMLCAALLAPRAPDLIVLNEPEASLHVDLVAPLARLVAQAATHSQIIVVSHARALVEALDSQGFSIVELTKLHGETIARDHDAPSWAWPER